MTAEAIRLVAMHSLLSGDRVPGRHRERSLVPSAGTAFSTAAIQELG
jgi:hypothetical protein